ncbi:MAG: hypothetical protein ACI4VP_03325 [Clostridia bacterium]
MEEKNEQMNEQQEKKKRKKVFQKWWFWSIIGVLALVTIIILVMCLKPKLKKLSAKIKEIDSSVIMYTSLDNNSIVIEIPNYTDEKKESKKEKVLSTIEEYSKKNKIPKKYTKLIIITRIDSDSNKDYFLNINEYKLPGMKENEDESMIYIDFIEFTKTMLGTSDSSSSTNTSTTTSTAKGEDITLTAGKYTVGEDVKAGKYDIIAQSGHGNFYIPSKVNETMGTTDDDFYLRNYNNVTLKNGDTIDITSSLKVLLQAK